MGIVNKILNLVLERNHDEVLIGWVDILVFCIPCIWTSNNNFLDTLFFNWIIC